LVLNVLLAFEVNSNSYDAGMIPIIEESSHRPTYYNIAHRSSNHVDYDRKLLAMREKQKKPKNPKNPKKPHKPLTPFDPRTDLSYYVHVLYEGSVFCAGALITRRMAITSARCFLPDPSDPSKQFKAEQMTVLSGRDFLNSTPKPSQAIGFFIEAPTTTRSVHNVAIIALANKLPRDKYRYIPLYSRMPPTGAQVTMSFMDHKTHNITLYETKVLSMDSCKETYEEYGKMNIPFTKEFFCVANRKKDGCSTRPGDPLIIDNKLAGINLYGEHCDELQEGRKADIYHSLRHSVKFIQKGIDLLRAFTKSGPYNST
ncbi:hypothetical protein KR093_008207, partial [Drosophila rubida]